VVEYALKVCVYMSVCVLAGRYSRGLACEVEVCGRPSKFEIPLVDIDREPT
jgi:hypothetical protein